MTLLSIIELIQEEYPKYGEGYLKIKINTIYKNFCHKTQILKRGIDVPSDSPAWMLTGKYAELNLTTLGVDRVKEVIFKDVSDIRIQAPYKYEIYGQVLRLYYIRSLGDVIDDIVPELVDNLGDDIVDDHGDTFSFGDAFNIISMDIVAIPKPLNSLDDETELSDDFSEAIIFGVKEGLAFGAKDYPGASYCRSKYKELVIEGMKEGNEGKDGTPLTPDMHFQ